MKHAKIAIIGAGSVGSTTAYTLMLKDIAAEIILVDIDDIRCTGETLIWWGMWMISASVPFGLFTIISPITITLLLLFVSGIPLKERLFVGNTDYEQYKKETSAFIPLPPRL